GIGILYGKEALLAEMPPYQGGGDMIELVTFPKTTYNVLPMKFEAGTPLIAEVFGLGKALDYLNETGLKHIQKWEQDLLFDATEKIKTIKEIHLIGQAPDKAVIISFVVDGIHT